MKIFLGLVQFVIAVAKLVIAVAIGLGLVALLAYVTHDPEATRNWDAAENAAIKSLGATPDELEWCRLYPGMRTLGGDHVKECILSGREFRRQRNIQIDAEESSPRGRR
jgi:hypothetical protein